MILILFDAAVLLKRYSKNDSDLMKNNWNYDQYNNYFNNYFNKVE